MLLNFKAQASVNNVNFRKEKKGSDEFLAVDVSLAVMLPVSELHSFCVDQPEITFAEFFYEQGRLLELCVGTINLTSELFMHSVELNTLSGQLDPIRLDDVKMNKFSVELQPERVMRLSFRIQKSFGEVESEKEEEVIIARLAEMIKKKISVLVVPPIQQDFIDDVTQGAVGDDTVAQEDKKEVWDFALFYSAAVDLLNNTHRTTLSYYVETLGITEVQAEALLDEMESNGLVGPDDGSGIRQIIEDPGEGGG